MNKKLISLAFLAPVRCRPDQVFALSTMAALTNTTPAAIAPEIDFSDASCAQEMQKQKLYLAFSS